MNSGHGLTLDQLAQRAHSDNTLSSRHVPGLSDQIGDRVLILDERGLPSLELLRFRKALTASAGFEVALRRRVELLSQFRHPGFAATPAVEYLGETHDLALLSPHTPGRRLADVLEDAQGFEFACSLIEQLTPALATLHRYGDGIGHGALTASRIMIRPEGQLVIVEHVLGSALERLQLTPERMQLELGIRVPNTGWVRPRADARTDFFQLGLVALSLLVGGPLGALNSLNGDSRPDSLARLLDQTFAASDRDPAEEFRGLREWLDRALQLDGEAFPSSDDALAALRGIENPDRDAMAERWRELLRVRYTRSPQPLELPSPSTPFQDTSSFLEIAPAADSELPTLPAVPVAPVAPVAPLAPVAPVDPVVDEAFETVAEAPRPFFPAIPVETIEQPKERAMKSRPDFLKWAVAALALAVVAEGVVIGLLLSRTSAPPPVQPVQVAEVNLLTSDPGASVIVDGRPAGVTPMQLRIDPGVRQISVESLKPVSKQEQAVGSTGLRTGAPARIPEAAANPGARPGAAPAPAPPPQKLGGVRLTSPIELEVFEGDKRLGSSATGIVSASAGRHEFELVNSALGFRSRQVVDVKDGQVLSLVVTPPNGRININATPWAEVLIDGKVVGETPIGNYSIALGEHEIVLRHPQLGEIRRTVLVRSDAIARVSANLDR